MTRRRRILALIDYCGPGDVLRMHFCLTALRRNNRDAIIDVVVGEQAHPVVRGSPLFDRILVSTVHRPRGGAFAIARKLLAALRLSLQLRPRYDLAIAIGWGTTVQNLLGRLLSRRNVGYANRFPRLLHTDFGGWNAVRHRDWDAHNLRLLEAVGIRDGAPSERLLICGPSDRAAVDALLSEAGIAGELVVLHPGSDWACQQWLQERWAALADRLFETYGANVAFTGVAAEKVLIEGIRARMRHPSVSLAGRTTLAMLQALTERARLCVCVDSSINDLTLGADVPTVVLAGPTDSNRPVVPLRPRVEINEMSDGLREEILECRKPRYVRGGCLDYTCPRTGLREISVASVLSAIEAVGLRPSASAGGGAQP